MHPWTAEELIEKLLRNELDEQLLLQSAEEPELGRVLDRLQEMLHELSDFRQADVPAAALQRALSLCQPRSWVQEAMRTLRAVLVSDLALPATAAVRSETGLPAANRYLRFEAEGHAAEMHVVQPAAPERYELSGRLLEPQGQAPFLVRAQPEQGAEVAKLSDELGRFHFPELEPGRYALTLELDAVDLSLPAVHLGQPEAGQPSAEP